MAKKEVKSDFAKRLDSLTKKERKIYDSLMAAFPATNPESAFNHAINGGVKFDFIPR